MSDSETNLKLIGYWMSKKKSHKINWTEFTNISRKYGYELREVDLERSLETQGPFTIFLHKLTDIIALASQGDSKSQNIIDRVEQYIKDHQDMIVIDPLDNVRILLDRCRSYNIIIESNLAQYGVFTPTFVELQSATSTDNLNKLKEADIGYPFLCKPSVAHGSTLAHKMSIIFHEKYIGDCFKPPCVAQKFIPHNAILYKIFVVGDKFFIVERPSLKNFYATERETIFFNSHDISKAASQSTLSVLDPEDLQLQVVQPEIKVFKCIVATLRQALGMCLFGVDVIIENNTRKYYIIDINAYPGYDGYPDFFNDLMLHVKQLSNNESQLPSEDVQNNDTKHLFNNKHTIY